MTDFPLVRDSDPYSPEHPACGNESTLAEGFLRQGQKPSVEVEVAQIG